MSKWFLFSFLLSLVLSAYNMFGCTGETSKEPASPKTTQPKPEEVALSDERRSVTLKFGKEETAKSVSIGELVDAHGLESWSAYDSYYKKEKSWKSIRLLPVIKSMFKLNAEQMRTKSFMMRASDGYSVLIRGDQLLEDDAYLAVEDNEHPDWELVGEQKANPGPVYMIWKKPEHHDLHAWPRPWQLAHIEIATFEEAYAKIIPQNIEEDSLAAKGFELFKHNCVRCHAVNRQGGRLGPELNVPQNITEYRPEEQIKAYIKNPLTFRYGSMPAFEQFEPEELDAIVAYFKVMRDQKFDPASESESDTNSDG